MKPTGQGGYQPREAIDWRTLTPPRGGSSVQPAKPVIVVVQR